jgi:tetratricopeptide repeat protein/NB-ARC domain-containing protein
VDRDVATALEEPNATAICQVLSGLGGVGKTQLAAMYATRVFAAGKIDLLAWITADSRNRIVDGLAEAAADILGSDTSDAERSARRFLSWLASTQKQWLIILDDVANPADLRGLWPPDTRTGATLVTTRRRDATLAEGRRLVDVGLFTAAEAVAYLQGKLPGQPVDQLEQLVADLGYLPLALAHAATFMSNNQLSCPDYRGRLADRRKRLAEVMPEPGDGLPDDYRETIAATWSMSIDNANRLRPRGLARPVLELSAMLDANGIPTGVFTSSVALDYLNTWAPSDEAGPADAAAVRDAMHVLRRFSLVSIDSEAEQLRVHALVQRATREQLTSSQLKRAALTCADALVSLWPRIERDHALSSVLRSCAVALRNNAEDRLWQASAHPILARLGDSLGETGQAPAAADHFRCLARDAATRLGAEHPDTLTAQHRCARWMGQAGGSAGARNILADLLATRMRVSSPTHPDTLFVASDLARWTGWAGEASAARDMLVVLLAKYEQVHGPEHRHTLTIRGELGAWIGYAGEPGRARDIYTSVVAASESYSDRDDPLVLNAKHGLAFWTGQAGDPAAARDQLTEIISQRQRVLGEEHRDTLRSRRDHARWTGEAGDPAKARTLLNELVPIYERVCGGDHPLVLSARLFLAHNTGQAGDASSARDMLAYQIVPIREAVDGPEHPNTLLARANHARWIGKAGDGESARQYLGELASRLEHALGRSDHPDVRAVRAELADWEAGSANDGLVLGSLRSI